MHTPGPWQALCGHIRAMGDTREIVQVQGPGYDEEDSANLHLIAASPDLLAALRAARKHNEDAPQTEYDGRMENGCCFDDNCKPKGETCPRVALLAQIDAAIAKAMGSR